jgi:hypothetical protein
MVTSKESFMGFFTNVPVDSLVFMFDLYHKVSKPGAEFGWH